MHLIHNIEQTEFELHMGCERVQLCKEYGPLIFADIRVTADHATCQWVVERQRINTLEWVEVARIEGQLDDEFTED